MARNSTKPDETWRAALDAVPRRPFIEGEMLRLSLQDLRLPGGPGHATLPRETMERVLEALAPGAESRVLEIGTGSGYAAAVLAKLAGQVFSIERSAETALAARNRLRALGHDNVLVRRGEGFDGWAEEAPFDAVFVQASSGQVGPQVLGQLAVGGSLVLAERPFRPEQRLMRMRRTSAEVFEREDLGTVRLVPRVGDLLVEAGLAERSSVEAAAAEASRRGEQIGAVLCRDHDVEESDLYRALALQGGHRFATLDTLTSVVDRGLVRSVSRAFAEKHLVIPVYRSEGRLVVATCTPETGLHELAQVFGAPTTEAVLVTPTDFRRFWSALDLGQVPTAGEGPALTAPPVERDDLLAKGGADLDAHAVSLLDALLLDAIGERASDIHLEIYDEDVRVRLRVDGELHDCKRFSFDRAELLALINVLKVSAGLDITERRLPQGGRFRRRAGRHAFDLRLQTQPSLHGEHAVIRLLPEDSHHLDVEELGFSADTAKAWRRLLRSPSGLVLVVGPTGSGKTTTLYAGLRLLADDETRKVLTIEDPIEYSIRGVQQTQVNRAAGYRFPDAMRSFVRQDPDVILVGEVRDPETALEALRASQTGHLVLSTLHCNDAPDSVQRLIDLGQHPNSIASELLAVLAQRLGRRICDSCRGPADPDHEILAEVFPGGAPADFRCFEGRGCQRCGQRGTHGRTAVAELLLLDERLRDLISREPPLSELRAAARAGGMATLRDHALGLVREAVIAFGELPRLLSAEQLGPPS